VRAEAAAIAQHCGSELAVTALVDKGSAAAQRTAIATAGQLVVATPGRVAQAGAYRAEAQCIAVVMAKRAACHCAGWCVPYQRLQPASTRHSESSVVGRGDRGA
jgi:hypothetical protein